MFSENMDSRASSWSSHLRHSRGLRVGAAGFLDDSNHCNDFSEPSILAEKSRGFPVTPPELEVSDHFQPHNHITCITLQMFFSFSRQNMAQNPLPPVWMRFLAGLPTGWISGVLLETYCPDCPSCRTSDDSLILQIPWVRWRCAKLCFPVFSDFEGWNFMSWTFFLG